MSDKEHYQKVLDDGERKFTVKEVFKVKDRICVVIELEWKMSSLGTWHNGYVSTLKGEPKRHDSDLETDEITFNGDLDVFEIPEIPEGYWFLGFDSGHLWNENNPQSKTFEEVKKRTIELAEEMIRKGI